MKNVQTGATPEQINDAIRRHCANLWEIGGYPPPDDERIRAWLDRTQTEQIHGTVDYWAVHLVPPGFVITRVGDVLAPEDRAAIRQAWEWLEAESSAYYDVDPQAALVLDRLRELAEGGAS